MKTSIINLLFLAVVTTTLTSGCSKDDQLDCEKNDTGTIKIINNEDDSYEIFIDNVSQGILAGKSYVNVEKGSGFHEVYYLQNEGYVFTPSEKRVTGTLEQCGEMVTTN